MFHSFLLFFLFFPFPLSCVRFHFHLFFPDRSSASPISLSSLILFHHFTLPFLLPFALPLFYSFPSFPPHTFIPFLVASLPPPSLFPSFYPISSIYSPFPTFLLPSSLPPSYIYSLRFLTPSSPSSSPSSSFISLTTLLILLRHSTLPFLLFFFLFHFLPSSPPHTFISSPYRSSTSSISLSPLLILLSFHSPFFFFSFSPIEF